MLYTIEEINEYRAGWLETHPNEVLDTDTVISCLNDERAAMIETLIDDDMRGDATALLEHFLRWGFDGYEKLTHTELWVELDKRGLEL